MKICKYHVGDDLSQLWPKLFNEIQIGGRVDDIKENFHLDKRVNVLFHLLFYLILFYSSKGFETFP